MKQVNISILRNKTFVATLKLGDMAYVPHLDKLRSFIIVNFLRNFTQTTLKQRTCETILSMATQKQERH